MPGPERCAWTPEGDVFAVVSIVLEKNSMMEKCDGIYIGELDFDHLPRTNSMRARRRRWHAAVVVKSNDLGPSELVVMAISFTDHAARSPRPVHYKSSAFATTCATTTMCTWAATRQGQEEDSVAVKGLQINNGQDRDL
jgi:hypothetical protein